MSKIIDWIMTHRWAITPEALLAIIDIAERVTINIDPKIFHGDLSTLTPEFKESLGITKKSLTPTGGRYLEANRNVHVFGNVGIIDVFGPIFPRSSSMSLSSPGMTVAMLNRALDAALDASEISSIVLNVDSPGGEITDIDSFGDKVFNAQAKKPIVAFVTGMAASAGYWIASSTSEIIAARTSEVGSIGVIAAIRDTSAKDEKAGVKNINIVSSISPKKRPDYTTKEGQEDIQAIVDELGMMFVGAVARNRGTDNDDVISNYGKGGMLLSTKAIKLGMVDRIDSLENVIKDFNNKSQSNGGTIMSDTLVKNATAESIKAENPNVYQLIFDEGKKISEDDKKLIKDEGFKEGVLFENDRIKGIESLEDSTNKDLIAENKFNTEMSKEDVALVIVNKAKEDEKKKAGDHAADAKDLANAGIQTDVTNADDDERKSASDAIAAAMDTKRGVQK